MIDVKLTKMIADMTPEQQEIYRVELERQHTLTNLLMILTETTDFNERNQAALALLDAKTPEHIDYHVAEKIIEVALRTKGQNGTLIYSLHKMGMPVKTSDLVKLLLESTTGEGFEETMEFFDESLFTPDNMAEQIAQLEAAMLTTTDEHIKASLLDAHTVLTEASMVPIQLPFDAKFTNLPWPILILNKSVADIAAQNGFELQFWEEDGLGPSSGFAVILPTGLWVSLYERKHLTDRGITTGPTIDIDCDATSNLKNLPALIAEVLNAFGLTEDDVQTKRTGFDTWSD